MVVVMRVLMVGRKLVLVVVLWPDMGKLVMGLLMVGRLVVLVVVLSLGMDRLTVAGAVVGVGAPEDVGTNMTVVAVTELATIA